MSTTKEERLADCEPMIRYLSRDIINRRNWLTAGGCDIDDVRQAGRMEVARLAEIHQDATQAHFINIARIAARRRMADQKRNVASQVGVRRVRGVGTGGVKGVSDPAKWVRLDASRDSVRFDDGGDDSRHPTPFVRDAEVYDSPRREFRAFLDVFACGLSAVQRDVFTWRYVDGMTLLAIGQLLGLSENRVLQIQREALDLLRNSDGIRIEAAIALAGGG